MILIFIHMGMLWLDPLEFIDDQLISRITGFPTIGEDPTTLFTNKAREKALVESMKDKFHTFRRKRGLDVANINDGNVQFETQVFSCELLRKFLKEKVSVTVIVTAEKCVEGVQMNWATFLVN
jgi:hypothetical protein